MQTKENPLQGGQVNSRQDYNVEQWDQSAHIAHLIDAITAAGLPAPPAALKLDGGFTRWGDKGSKPCWLVAHVLNNSHIAAAFGDWRTGTARSFKSWEIGAAVDPHEAKRLIDEYARRQKAAEEASNLSKAATAKRDKEIFDQLPEAGNSAYLERKRVGAYGVRFGADQYGSFVAVPMRTTTSKFIAFQRIYEDDRKRFPKSAEKKSAYHLIGSTLDPDGALHLAEGYATAATIHEATGQPVAVCFDAGNLRPVADALKSIYPDLQLIIAADNDQWKADELNSAGKPKGNAGIKYAFAVAHAYPGTKVAVPRFESLDTGSKPSDFNDLAALAGLDNVRRQLELAHEPKPGTAMDITSESKSAIRLLCNAKGRPLAVIANVIEILMNDERWQGVFGYDEFSGRAMLMRRPPYDTGTGEWKPREITDNDDRETAAWLQRHYEVHVSPAATFEGVRVVVSKFPFHPVKQYLESLIWDGTARLDSWLIRLFGAANTDYIKAVSAKILIGAVARIYKPGCKVDTVPILEGEQGTGKSTTWRVLASDEWYTDCLPDMHSKDAMLQLQGKWIIELAELSALTRSEVELTKRFISAQYDRFRPPYGRHTIEVPRQSLFAGTTNADDYLKDSTGNRRFLPIRTKGYCDIAGLTAERNQLWAEAVHRFNAGEQWHIDGKLAQDAAAEQEERLEGDLWEAPILEWLDNWQNQEKDFITGLEIAQGALGFEHVDKVEPKHARRIGSIMRRNGWHHKASPRDPVTGKRIKGYQRPEKSTDTPPKGGKHPDGTDNKPVEPIADSYRFQEKPNRINAGTDGTDGTDNIGKSAKETHGSDDNGSGNGTNNLICDSVEKIQNNGSIGSIGSAVPTLSNSAKALHALLAGYKGFEQPALLAKRLRWNEKDAENRVLKAAHELQHAGLAVVLNDAVKPVRHEEARA